MPRQWALLLAEVEPVRTDDSRGVEAQAAGDLTVTLGSLSGKARAWSKPAGFATIPGSYRVDTTSHNQNPMPLKPGATLRHRYRIESVLGQGGMGAVYKAIDINLGVSVAVKENLFTTDEFARQFRREATILASLRHPNLPRVTDHFVVEGEGQYLVMDFIQGEDLRQRLERDGPIPESEALPWFLETCDALSYLHGRQPQIVHRDIKPGNIKITPEGRPMLVDFGLAKISDDTGSTTRGARAMTPGFSPPEQYGTGRTDGRTDIYSLGATIYAALTATIPEDGLERALKRAELTPLRKRNPNVTPAMARAVEVALAVRPEDRYATAADFAAALSATATPSRPTLPRAYPHLERSTKIAPPRPEVLAEPDVVVVHHASSRQRGPLIAIGIVTGLLILGGGIFGLADQLGWLGRATPPPPSLGVTPPAAASTRPGATSLPALLPTSPLPTSTPTASSPAAALPTPAATPIGGGGGQVAFASSRTGIPQIYLVNVDATGLTQLTNLPDGACQPEWSPDGLQLTFTSPCRKNQDSYPGSNLYVMNADGSGLRPLPPRTGGGDFDPAWSPDGLRLAFTSLRENNRAQIMLMNLDGSAVTDLTPPAGVDSQPAWSPLGTQLVFRGKRLQDAQIWITTDATGSEKRFSRGGQKESHPDWSHDGQMMVWDRIVDGVSRLVIAPYNEGSPVDRPVCPDGQLSVQPMAEPHWSPDGQWIVFETWPTGDDHNIAILTSSCTNYTPLTEDPALDFDAAWRP
jgi:serine/threonine protein kinase